MKKYILTFALLLTSSLALAATSFAQDGGRVVVLDVARVFAENLEFSQAMDGIRAKADQVKQEIEQSQNQIRTDAEKLASMAQGSQERNQLEAELEQRQTALRTQARQQETDLLTQEAQLYYKTYQKMQQIVASLSQEYNISLVLRFDSAPINKDDRGDVIMGVNRAVVYHLKLDLTNKVLESMGPTVAKKPEDTLNR